MHAREGVVFCPECGTQAGQESALLADGELESVVQAG